MPPGPNIEPPLSQPDIQSDRPTNETHFSYTAFCLRGGARTASKFGLKRSYWVVICVVSDPGQFCHVVRYRVILYNASGVRWIIL